VELFGEYALNMSSDFLNVSYDVHVVITRKWSLGLLVLPGANPPPPCSHGNAVCTISSESLRYDPTTSLIQDIELSREINESFRQSAQARTKLPSGIELNVHVLTTGYYCLSSFLVLSCKVFICTLVDDCNILMGVNALHLTVRGVFSKHAIPIYHTRTE
jgi:hypothetical protein